MDTTTTQATHDLPDDPRAPYPSPVYDSEPAGPGSWPSAECPVCGTLSVGPDEDRAIAAYRSHYRAAAQSEDIARRAAAAGIPDPMPIIDGMVGEVMAQLDEFSDDTWDRIYGSAHKGTHHPDALKAIAEDFRLTLVATLDQRVSDYLADLNVENPGH
jgi:hypothetical protein